MLFLQCFALWKTLSDETFDETFDIVLALLLYYGPSREATSDEAFDKVPDIVPVLTIDPFEDHFG